MFRILVKRLVDFIEDLQVYLQIQFNCFYHSKIVRLEP